MTNLEKENTLSSTDLNTIIMSVVHDVKNSLLSSSATLEKIALEVSTTQQLEIDSVQNEIKSVNQSLIRLLTLYKMQTDVFSLRRDQYNIYDMLEELVLANSSNLSSKHLTIELQCDDSLEWFYDIDLINNIINSTINNSLRYAKTKIVLKATIENDMLAIGVEDDGVGYPQKIIDEYAAKNQKITTDVNFRIGNSGLGLFFAATIAKLHEFKNKHGYTRIHNIKTGGSCFTIYLP